MRPQVACSRDRSPAPGPAGSSLGEALEGTRSCGHFSGSSLEPSAWTWNLSFLPHPHPGAERGHLGLPCPRLNSQARGGGADAALTPTSQTGQLRPGRWPWPSMGGHSGPSAHWDLKGADQAPRIRWTLPSFSRGRGGEGGQTLAN
ncbi:Hypothetical predicted protein [Marmota monax]|uniref:Uncharacterized protein n=1 Tax=Marmota monax TaxID=9995 RepID=A0A5E4A221_MARMO|nr:Hypothetical predicted protein [Marmota monax]